MATKTRKKQKKLSLAQRLSQWLRQHRLDILICSALLLITGLVSGVNMANSPQRFEDEGTYVSQAWAVQYRGELTHYTYWYDHPPVAWLQIAAYTTVTGAFERYDSAITAGREFMVILHLITVLLVYLLGRRLMIGRTLSLLASLLFGLSPLAVEFSRYVLLDNVALPWLLAAFFLALTPRRHLLPIIGSAVCMAVAVLSKETFLIFLPALAYMLWQNSDQRNRRFMVMAFSVVFLALVAFYALYAMIKSEFFPGEGHVSLLGTLFWQLFGREGSGSLLDPTSDSRNLFNYWLSIDGWLFWAGVVALPFAWFYRSARPLALALTIGLLMMLRGGYLPYPYIIALLPLAALVIAAALQRFIVLPMADTGSQWWRRLGRYGASVVAIGLALSFTYGVAPGWQDKLTASLTSDPDGSSRQAVDWMSRNIGRDSRMVVESALWTDLQNRGFNQPDPVWLYKTETDPEVAGQLSGWRGIDYIVLYGPTLDESSRSEFPTVFEAKDNAEVVVEFGQDAQKVVIMRVNNQQ